MLELSPQLNRKRKKKVKSSTAFDSDDIQRKYVKFSTVSYDIHEDMLLQILYKMPVRVLVKFSCISKLWFNLINKDQEFNKHHFIESQKKPILIFSYYKDDHKNRSYYLGKEEHGSSTQNQKLKLFRNQNTKILESIRGVYHNGIACYWNNREYYDGEWVYFSLEICNPSRHEKLIIVSRFVDRVGGDSMGEQIIGFRFGYDLLSNEFKIMCIMRYKGEFEYYIYTLGSSKPWRQINNPWPKLRPLDKFLSNNIMFAFPISCNGTIFYEVVKDEWAREKYKLLALVAFDLHDEKFQIVELPGDDEFVSSYNKNDMFPMEYKGCFCYIKMQKTLGFCRVNIIIHILKDSPKQVWVKEIIKFDLPRELDIPARRLNPDIVNFSNQLIMYWGWYNKQQNGQVIQFYNVHSKELTEVKHPDEGLYRCCYYISKHVENFLSLKALATTKGKGNTSEELMENSYLRQELFNHIPTSNPAVISILEPL